MIFNMTGGGTSLNFKVVGGTTQPTDPKENTIWVNTSTAITDWVFSATQPTAASGRVWISTGTSSGVEFNALKKNAIQVYPVSAKQYVSGSWKDVTAMSYQGGKWVDWAYYLYNAGDICVGITGGWTSTGMTYASNNECTPVIPILLDQNKQLVVQQSAGWKTGIAYAVNDIDLTKFKTVEFTGYASGPDEIDNTCLIVIPSSATTYWSQNAACKATLPRNSGTKASVDVSNLTGKYRIGVGILTGPDAGYIYIDKIELK